MDDYAPRPVELSDHFGTNLFENGRREIAPARAIPFGRALRLGIENALSLWPAVVASFLAGWGARLAALLAFGAVWAIAREQGGSSAMEALVGLGICWLVAQLLRALALGAGIRQGSLRTQGVEQEDWLVAVLKSAGVAWGWLLCGAAIDLAVWGWQAAALVLTGAAFFVDVVARRSPFLAAAGLSWALVWVIPLGIAAALWTQYAFSRAIAAKTGYLAALFDSAAILWRRPWAPLGLWALTAAVGWVLELFVVALTPGGASGRGPSLVWIGAAIVAAGLHAFVRAVVDLSRFDAFAALELSRTGELAAADPSASATLELPAPVQPPVQPERSPEGVVEGSADPRDRDQPSHTAFHGHASVADPSTPALRASAQGEREDVEALLAATAVSLTDAVRLDCAALGGAVRAAWQWTSATGDLEVEVWVPAPGTDAEALAHALDAIGPSAHPGKGWVYRVHERPGSADATTASRVAALLLALAAKD